jgi:hypothetical protein
MPDRYSDTAVMAKPRSVVPGAHPTPPLPRVFFTTPVQSVTSCVSHNVRYSEHRVKSS